MNSEIASPPGRRYDLDWLRVIVTINLIPFHAAWMITSVGGFSFVKKGTLAWKVLAWYVEFVSPLHMFLLFMIAGAGTCLALQFRSPGQYIRERIRRLLIPLLVFMVFLFALLGYFWPTGIDLTGINYFTEFWPWCLSTTFYSDFSGGPNWAHMWFVGYLFIYSLVLLPFFLLVRKRNPAFIGTISDLLAGRNGNLFLAGIPIALIFAVLSPVFPFFRNNLYSDWGYFTYNMAAFILGFIISRDPRFIESFERHSRKALLIGIVLSTAKLWMHFKLPSFSTPGYNREYIFFSLVAGFNTWAWIIVFMNAARKRLDRPDRFLGYFSRISYPFYIFHLVVISVTGHYITQMKMDIIAEFAILCVASYLITLASCELVKRTRVTRVMFGVKNSSASGSGTVKRRTKSRDQA